MNDIDLSIVVPTYCHEKYIGKALDSILMQKTKYSIEILVGEDASPDGTRAILKEYEKRFPNVFTMIYRDVNAGDFGSSNCGDLIRRAVGKYICMLEGDDYWVSSDKIEKQIDILEKDESVVAVACRTIVVDEDSIETGEKYPECENEVYRLSDYRRGILPGQTGSMVYRTEVYKKICNDKVWETKPMPGDRITYLGVAAYGKIVCIQDRMSAYRHITRGGSSFSATNTRDFEKECIWYINLIDFAKRLHSKNAVFAAEGRFLAYLFYDGLLLKKISLINMIKYVLKFNHPCVVLILKLYDVVIKG